MVISIFSISLILQSIFSNFTRVIESYFTPLFAICALILVYPYFKNKNYFLFSCIFYGMLYDILFSNFLLMHCFLFFLLGIVIMILNHLWNNHIYSVILFTVITIGIYRIIYYFLLSIIEKIEWTSFDCFKMVIEAMMANIIYIIGAYFITDFISKKYKIYKID